MTKYFIILLTLISTGIVQSQSNQSLMIQFDKPLYTTGETVWFAIFNLDSGLINEREVVHYELISPRNERVIEGKVLAEGRLVDGYFKLSTDFDEGYYRFRAFTIRSLKDGGTYISADLPIYNEWREDLTVYKYEEIPKEKAIEQPVQREKRRETYNRRDTVAFGGLIENPLKGWEYVFWVHPKDFGKFPGIKSEIKSIPSSINLYSNLNIEDSLYFEANLTQTGSELGVTSSLISIYSGYDKKFYRSKAVEGKFILKIPYYEGESTLQVFNLNPYQDAVNKLSLREWRINEGYFNPSKPVMTSEIAEYLIKAKRRRKVNDLFAQSLDQRIIIHSDSSLAVPDLSYQMSDYRYISDLKEFIFEAIPGAKMLTLGDGTNTARLYNPERRATFVDRPWYIVDGYLTSREEEVLKIPFNHIDEINLYVHTNTIRKYFEYFLWRNGIMEVKTNDIKYKRSLKTDPNYVDFKGFIPAMDFLETILQPNELAPDLRTTIYWETGHWKDESQEIRFPLSDDTGEFIYHLIAVSDSGEVIRKEGSIQVN